MGFNEWLEERLKEEVSDHYDADGNSSRAVVCRMKKGVINSIWYECKEVAKDIKSMFTYDWDGLNTPVAWFVQLAWLPVIVWFLPLTRSYGRYNRAIRDYKMEYSKFKPAQH